MGYFPNMDGKEATNVYEEHVFKMQLSFGASTALTYLGKDIVAERPSATTLKVTFPQQYVRVTSAAQFWAKATGADPVQLQITTDNLAVDGTITFTSTSTNSAGTATAPANGDKCWLALGVSQHDLNAAFGG